MFLPFSKETMKVTAEAMNNMIFSISMLCQKAESKLINPVVFSFAGFFCRYVLMPHMKMLCLPHLLYNEIKEFYLYS